MWRSTRVDGFDDNRLEKRALCVDMSSLNGARLRTGLVFQLGSFSAMMVLYWVYGGSGFFSFDLSGLSEEARGSSSFRHMLAIFAGVYLWGSVHLVMFQSLMADDAAWARGFRAGSKILRLATLLDFFSSTMQFIFYLYIAKFYSEKWYEHFQSGGSEMVFLAYARLMHSISFALYGVATFLLEVYHDEGAGDLHAHINMSFYLTAAVAEEILVFTRFSLASSGLVWATLLVATTWAYFFEPEVNYASPPLEETELTNDVEQQVEKFTRMTGYEQY